MMWLLLSCTSSSTPDKGPWTEEAALTPTATLGGGTELSAADYSRTSYAALPLAEVDADGSGALSARELAALIRRQDPMTFDESQPMGALTRETWSQPFAEPALKRATWELLAFLRAEVAAVAPGAELPDDATLDAAAATEDLYSEPVQAVLRQLEALHQQHSLAFPDGLIRKE